MGKMLDLTGHRFGKILVLDVYGKNSHGGFMWQCVCDCGNTVIVASTNLVSGNTKSCRCVQHRSGRANDLDCKMLKKALICWRGIKKRCFDETCNGYAYYGGRGVTVCQLWRESFDAFLSDVGLPPSSYHSIDRIDTNGNYTPENCRWVLKGVQSHNRNKVKNTSSQYIGVHFSKEKRKWRARIRCGDIYKHLGYFSNSVDAAIAYDNESYRLYGDRPNKTEQCD